MDFAEQTHRRLLIAVGLVVAVTGAGLVWLWPAAGELPDAPEGGSELIDGTIRSVTFEQQEPDPVIGESGRVAIIDVQLTSGEERGEIVTIEAPVEGYPPIDVGDEVQLSSTELPDTGTEYFIVDFQRLDALLWLAALFVAAVLLVSRWHGLRSLIGLGLSLLIITKFVVPSILAGNSPFLVALFGALAVMVVTLYLSHGVNEMTTAAVVGTAAALGLTVLLGVVFIEQGELTGFSSEEANLARFAVEGLDLRGLVLAGLIIAALGVLDDVTVSQSSTVFALHDADPTQSWRQLFGRAMIVGRDHIASTVNTLFLAYAGASIALLVLFATGGLGIGEIVNSEIFAEEAVKTLVGSLGLIAAVPFTTALAATVAVRRPPDAPPVRGLHAHGADEGTVPDGGPEDEEEPDDDQSYAAWLRYLRTGMREEADHLDPQERRSQEEEGR